MSITVMTSKGQVTVPKEVREILHLKPSDKVIITVEDNRAILRPFHGNILDIGGTIEIPKGERPIDFGRVRGKVRRAVAMRDKRKTGAGR